MKRIFLSIFWEILKFFPNLDLLVRFWCSKRSIVNRYGWKQSVIKRIPIDENGNPLPWYTYPFIKFVKHRIKADFEVFEYGAGYSTLWYKDKVKRIVAVEHNKEWFCMLSKALKDNVTIILREDSDTYVKEILNHGFFDIVVIDGIERVK